MQQLCCLSFRKLYDQSRPTLGSKSCGFLKGKKKKARKKGREKGGGEGYREVEGKRGENKGGEGERVPC